MWRDSFSSKKEVSCFPSASPTYLIEVQEGISRRDRGVLKITPTSGQPPSALRMLERCADLEGVALDAARIERGQQLHDGQGTRGHRSRRGPFSA